jgi:thiamine pyrophosphate-dependent acetolactate synthase large subunit-like protein
MSTASLLRSLSLATAVGFAALALGCQTTEPHDRAATSADQVVAVGSSSGDTQVHLDKTLNALDEVVAKAKVDPKSAYDTFAKSLGQFSSSFAALKQHRATLAQSTQTWFGEFEKQNNAIQDESLRKLGEERLTEFRSQIGDVSKQIDELMAGTSTLEGQLNSLRTYLGNDLTEPGIEAVASRISDTTKDGRKLAGGLGKLSKSSTTVAEKLRAARPPPAAAK